MFAVSGAMWGAACASIRSASVKGVSGGTCPHRVTARRRGSCFIRDRSCLSNNFRSSISSRNFNLSHRYHCHHQAQRVVRQEFRCRSHRNNSRGNPAYPRGSFCGRPPFAEVLCLWSKELFGRS